MYTISITSNRNLQVQLSSCEKRSAGKPLQSRSGLGLCGPELGSNILHLLLYMYLSKCLVGGILFKYFYCTILLTLKLISFVKNNGYFNSTTFGNIRSVTLYRKKRNRIKMDNLTCVRNYDWSWNRTRIKWNKKSRKVEWAQRNKIEEKNRSIDR